jgi:hypothetical protein
LLVPTLFFMTGWFTGFSVGFDCWFLLIFCWFWLLIFIGFSLVWLLIFVVFSVNFD